jgi:hypothetical protein
MERVEKKIQYVLGARVELPYVRPLVVVAEYDSTDPFAVTLVFGRRQAWRFAYDLLVEALTLGEAGEGDVRVCVRDDAPPEERVLITLDSPEGHAEIAFRIDEMVAFMRRIERVTANTDLTIDWDGFLAEVLDGAA